MHLRLGTGCSSANASGPLRLAEIGMRRANAAGGYDNQEFGAVLAMLAIDWAGDRALMARYRSLCHRGEPREPASRYYAQRLHYHVVPLGEHANLERD